MTATAQAPMRFERYAGASEIDYFAWWCGHYLVQSIEPFNGQPLILEPWQLEFMGEALAVEADLETQVWESVGLIVPRKNGKTQLLAAYALFRLLNDEGNPEVLLAAASDKNAGRLFDAVVLFIRSNPELAEVLHVREYVGEIARKDGRGKIIRLATDPTTLHGYNPSLVICDELHAWTKPSLRAMWTALTTGGGSRTRKQVFTITTAGDAAHRLTSILGRLLDGNEELGELKTPDKALTISRNHPGKTLIYNYAAPTKDPHNIEAMKLANPASWVSEAFLARQASNPELSDADVLQYHGCVWAAGTSTWLDVPTYFVPLEAQREILEGTACVLAFDGSSARDSTALVGATIEKHPHVWVEAVWERPAGDDKWRTPANEVLFTIDEAIERLDVWELAPDPFGWRREIEDLQEKYGDELVVIFETNSPRRMGPAADDFLQAVLGPGDPTAADLEAEGPLQRGEPELTHDGSEVLLRHLSNCTPERRSGFNLPTKDHTDSPRKIDVAIAAIVAYHRARWLYTRQSEDIVAMVVEPPQPKRPGANDSD